MLPFIRICLRSVNKIGTVHDSVVLKTFLLFNFYAVLFPPFAKKYLQEKKKINRNRRRKHKNQIRKSESNNKLRREVKKSNAECQFVACDIKCYNVSLLKYA